MVSFADYISMHSIIHGAIAGQVVVLLMNLDNVVQRISMLNPQPIIMTSNQKESHASQHTNNVMHAMNAIKAKINEEYFFA